MEGRDEEVRGQLVPPRRALEGLVRIPAFPLCGMRGPWGLQQRRDTMCHRVFHQISRASDWKMHSYFRYH